MPEYNALIKQLAEDEGYRQDVYECTNGYPTVGIGFALKDLKPKIDPDIALKIIHWQIDNGLIHLSLEHSQLILKKECPELNSKLSEKFSFYDSLPDMIQNVLLNMAFQIGVYGLGKFKKMIKAVEDSNWKMAADEMLDSKWARKDSPNRANRLADIVRDYE